MQEERIKEMPYDTQFVQAKEINISRYERWCVYCDDLLEGKMAGKDKRATNNNDARVDARYYRKAYG